MALKDLTVAKSELTEKQIEEIVGNHVRYDPAAKEVVFLPTASSLPNRTRVLLYLVALQGWPFVTDDPVTTEATPAEIEKMLHIPGGTLRPILKELKDSHFISARGRNYSVRAAALLHIKNAIGKGKGEGEGGTHVARRMSKKKKPDKSTDKAADNHGRRDRRKSQRISDKAEFFDRLISDGFFDKPRVLNDVKKQFHAKGHILPITSIPQYLLKAIRDERLYREMRDVDGKRVWVYERAKK